MISRIFNHADKENLGMEGHPAEFGLYLSVIKKHHLHKKIINGFEFSAPQKKDGKLFNFYETFNKIIKEKRDPIPLTEIYNFFSKPPYGLKKGLLPLLTATFFKINEGSMALYNVDDSRRESLITEYDLRICEKFVHIPEAVSYTHLTLPTKRIV